MAFFPIGDKGMRISNDPGRARPARKHPKFKYTLGVKEGDIERDALNGE